MGLLTGVNLIGAVFGFILGICSFIIVRYWIQPVSAYKRLKRRIANAVSAHLAAAASADRPPEEADYASSRKRLRKLAQELTDAYYHDLPNWYRIRIRSKGEQPPEAAAGLMKLSGSRRVDAAGKGAEKIRRLLALEKDGR